MDVVLDNAQHLLSAEHAAASVGISLATLRNWVKAGILTPAIANPACFYAYEIAKLQHSIHSGALPRLQSRANKSRSPTSIVPSEYATNESTIKIMQEILELFRSWQPKIQISEILFLIALRVVDLHNETAVPTTEKKIDLNSYCWKREALKREMQQWHELLSWRTTDHLYSALSRLLVDKPADDILGFLYLSLSSEGDKSTKGSYYTPRTVVEAALQSAASLVELFLDPCCGTGQFLLCAAHEFGLELQNIFGFDLDDLAVRIARINLLMAFPNTDASPQIRCLNAITELATGNIFCPTNHLLGGIDFIATNPPWGAYKNTQLPDSISGGIRSNEAFSLILAKSIRLLKDGGRLSFILPESILNIRVHADIRALILAETCVTKISHLGRPFSGVFTPVIRLDLAKTLAHQDSFMQIERDGKTHRVAQSRFSKNEFFAFDGNITETEDLLLTRLYDRHFTTLKGNAEWALGIVTGNNKAFIKSEPDGNMESIYKGSDIKKFKILTPSNFLCFDPKNFQQVAKLEFYRAPAKLLYKFISNKLVFAYDDQQRLTLNSANILIPKVPGLSTKSVLGFLNSNIFQYIFSQKFSTHKVLRGDLETLPFPAISLDTDRVLDELVDHILSGEDYEHDLNQSIYKIFDVTQGDIVHIESYLKSRP